MNEIKEIIIKILKEKSDFELATSWYDSRVEGIDAIVAYINSHYIAKEKVKSACEGIIANDKTPRYSYSAKGKNTFNAEGKQTGDGSRWSTPREIAEELLKYVKPTQQDSVISSESEN